MFIPLPPEQLSDPMYEDRFCQVELAVAFRKILCYECDFEAIYKYQVLQIRRRSEIQIGEEEEIRPDHVELWKTIPRFAEVPQTLKCKRCGEILGLYPAGIF